MKKMKHCFAVILATLSLNFVFAQTTFKGKITDEKGEPVIGANTYIKDSYDGATSDKQGLYSFSTDETGNRTLICSYIGYTTFEQNVSCNGNTSEINIVLQPTVNALDAVVISAGAFEASDQRRITILRPLDIVTTAGAAGDTYGALQTLPGTQVVGNQTGLFVRGGDASETKTFIDGVVVADPYFTSVPDIPQRGRFSPFLFKGTYFSTGGYSAQYGDAMSSALILDSQDLPDQTSTNISLMSVGGGLGHNHLWKNTSLGVFGSYINLQPYVSLVSQEYDYVKAPEAINGSIIFRQKTSKTGILKAFVSYSPISNTEINYPSLDTTNDFSRFKIHNDNFFANASYKELISKNWTLFSSATYSTNNNDLLFNSDSLRSSDDLFAGRITLSRPIGSLSSFRFGGESQYATYNDSYNQYANALNDLYSAAYAETDIYITQKLVTRLGGRLEYSDLLANTTLAPRVSFAYKTGKFSQVSFACGEFYQQPDHYYLYTTDNLNFEHADHYILNFQNVSEKQTFRVEAYYKLYHDLVKTFPDTSNAGTGYARGFEFFWRDKKFIPHADYWISYSFLDTKRDYLYYPYEAVPPFAAKHTLSIVYKQYIPKINVSIGGTYVFATGRTYYNPNSSTFLSDATPDYNNFSMNASYLTTILQNFTVFVISANNIFGFDHVYDYRFSSDGTKSMAIGDPAKRSFFIGIFMSIGEDKGDDE